MNAKSQAANPQAAGPRTAGMRVAPTASLWASAAVILALILTVAADRQIGSQARAEMVSQVGALTVMTAQSGTEEVLIVLDERSEKLLVYSAPRQDLVELRGGIDVAAVFREARSAARGN